MAGSPSPTLGTTNAALAFTVDATGTNLHETKGYPKDWFGKPSPSIVHWLPTSRGRVPITGQSQAAWSVVATDDYVVLGGEFPKVNSTNQQGLVRFGQVVGGAEHPGSPVRRWHMGADRGARVDDLAPGQLEGCRTTETTRPSPTR